MCENAKWNENGTTFKELDVNCGLRRSVFIDDDDNVYSLCNDNQSLSVWSKGYNGDLSRISFEGIQTFSSVLVSTEREVYFAKTTAPGYIVKRFLNSSNETFVANFSENCYGLFIDLNNTLYCSLWSANRIDMVSLNSIGNTISTRAGNGTSGSTSTQLSGPWGIFVDKNFDLYVADAGNHRIQRFRSGDSNGTTVAGSSIANNLSLNYPTDVVLDAFGHIYIADSANSRIIRVTSNTYQCLVGCSGNGSAFQRIFSAF